jgi:hypothetical protein
MPRISTQEFERLPLRVHDFLAGMPLHDSSARSSASVSAASASRETPPQESPAIAPSPSATKKSIGRSTFRVIRSAPHHVWSDGLTEKRPQF